MRWLFLFVLILNVAYVAWQVSNPSIEPYHNTSKKTDTNERTILLLSELRDQHQHETSPDVLNEVKSTRADSSPHDSRQAESKKAVTEKNTIAQSESRQPEAGPAENRTAGVKPAQKEQCYTLGPFRDLEVLRNLTNEIKPYVVKVDFRGKEAKDQPLYWVYIRPVKDRKTAIATGKELKANKIKDYFVIREGKNINGISLGYYRNKKSAYSLEDRVKKLGYDVVVESIYKTYTVYWLDYQLRNDAKTPKAIIDNYIKSSKKHRIKQLGRECDI